MNDINKKLATKIDSAEWIEISGYEGIYQVSRDGYIRSYDRTLIQQKGDVRYKRAIKGRMLKPRFDKDGYCRVTLYKNKTPKSFYVHRLVAMHFVANTENKPEINHKDGIKTNNSYLNLEWCTSKENSQHAIETGLMKDFRGEKSPNSKLTRKEVVEIRASNSTHRSLSSRYGVSRSTIYQVKSGVTWND